MNVVDPAKLDAVREVLDIEIARLCIGSSRRRLDSMRQLAHELGYFLGFFKVGDWYLCTAQSLRDRAEVDLYNDHTDWDRAGDLDVESRFDTFAVAGVPDDGALAVLVRLLDSTAEVFFDDVQFLRHYPGEAGDFGRSVPHCVQWYIRTQMWFQDVPQSIALDQIAAVEEC